MDYGRLTTEYLCYLMNRAHIDAEGRNGYLSLSRTLMGCSFFPILDMDENRCYECRELREDFADEYDEEEAGDILDGLYGEYGTMMELMVVMAEKMKYDLDDSEYEAGTGKWFREMLQNCGLLMCVNERYEQDEGYENEVKDVLDTIIYRKYGWDGEGGLFPVRCPKHDQRYAELVVQMNDYIEENYDIC